MILLLFYTHLLASQTFFDLNAKEISFTSRVFEVSDFKSFEAVTHEDSGNSPELLRIDSENPALFIPTSSEEIRRIFDAHGVLLRGVLMTFMQGTVIWIASGNMSLELIFYSVIAGTVSAGLQYVGPAYNLLLESKYFLEMRKKFEQPVHRAKQMFRDFFILGILSTAMNSIGHQLLGKELITAQELFFMSFIGIFAETALIIGLPTMAKTAQELRPNFKSFTREFTALNRLYFALLYTFPQVLSVLFIKDYPVVIYSAFGMVSATGITIHALPKIPAKFLLKVFDYSYKKARKIQAFQDKVSSGCRHIFGF